MVYNSYGGKHEKVTITTFMEKKLKRQPITWFTAYDYSTAQNGKKTGTEDVIAWN